MRKGNFRFVSIAFAMSLMLAGPLAEYATAQSSQTVGAPAATTQVPQPADNNVNWPGAGYGAGALLCNVLYIPAKLVYALLGGLVGGGTYLITAGNMQAANTVWRSSLGGDYVVTPQMLAGEQPLNFSGPTDTPPENAPAAVTSSSSTTTTASSGGIAPIAPLPASSASTTASSGTSGISGTSSTTASTSSSSGQPLDHGTGPTTTTTSNSNIE